MQGKQINKERMYHRLELAKADDNTISISDVLDKYNNVKIK